jgi:hypothetical protein
MEVWPASTLEASLPNDLLRGGIGELEVQFLRSGTRGSPNSLAGHTARCPIDSYRVRCRLPAGPHRLRLKMPGHVPVYRWDLTLAAEHTLDLGRLVLKPGASVSGWVQTAAGEAASDAEVRVSAWRSEQGAQSLEALQRSRATGWVARTNEFGFFQVDGLAPGAYEVTAEREGFARAWLGPLEVREGLESQLVESLVLAPPAELVVLVEPPVDPYGRPWTVALQPQEIERGASYVKEPVPEGGEVVLRGLAPGPYHLDVQDADGDYWASEPVMALSGPARHHVVVPVVEVRGLLVLGQEPLAAGILFSARDRRRVKMVSDDEGKFEGYLPREGEWSVALQGEGDRSRTDLDRVEVRRKPGKSYAELELRVPDTWVEGKVLDEAGQPVAGAEVRAGQLASGSKRRLGNTAQTDAKGRFELRGLPEGLTQFHASKAEATSDSVQTQVAEGTPAQVELRLQATQTLLISVSSDGGPVGGASLVVGAELVPGQGMASLSPRVSDLQGSVSLVVPKRATAVVGIVSAPSFATRIFRVEVPRNSQPLGIQLQRGGGRLTLDFARAFQGEPGAREAITVPLLLHGGALLPVQALSMSPLGFDRSQEVVTLGSFLPGEYSLCSGKAGTVAAREGNAEVPGCVSGYLPPGGELRLVLP